MRRMGVLHLADRDYTALSGGQRQLVLIARALCQEPRLLVMDEPTASLDYGNQELVLSTMRDLSLEGMGVLMVTHDPDHALYCADKVIVMEQGRVVATGSPQETITEETLERIYGIPTRVLDVEVAPAGAPPAAGAARAARLARRHARPSEPAPPPPPPRPPPDSPATRCVAPWGAYGYTRPVRDCDNLTIVGSNSHISPVRGRRGTPRSGLDGQGDR
jgi:hypothetical protein